MTVPEDFTLANTQLDAAQAELQAAQTKLTELEGTLGRLEAAWVTPPPVTPPIEPPVTPPVEPPATGDTWAASRDYRKNPFAPTSVWNRPVGKSAVLVPAGLKALTSNGGVIHCDNEFIGTSNADPSKTLTVTEGDKTLNGSKVNVPPTHSHDGSWNGCWAFVLSGNNMKIIQGQPLVLTAGGNPSTKWTVPNKAFDLKTDEGHDGCHGGSHLSIIGGSLRKGELTSPDPIHHALKINLYGSKFISNSNGGFRWPATSADGYHNEGYKGTVPACRMGCLLVLPQSYNVGAITDPKVRKIAAALQHYGAYLVDDTFWDVHAFCMEKGVSGVEWPNSSGTFHQQLQQVIAALSVVDNNSPGQKCSGGGEPVAPNLYAPI